VTAALTLLDRGAGVAGVPLIHSGLNVAHFLWDALSGVDLSGTKAA